MSEQPDRATRSVMVGLVAMMMTTSLPAVSTGAEAPADVPTFSEDVAPILYDHCVTCHRTGEVAPMSLITYEETRPWSRSIKNRVLAADMPPWHADPAVGHFLNDRRLSNEDKDTIARWVDAGAPEGDRSRLPSPPRFATGWQIGTPDVIIEMPEAFNVPAEGEVDYQYFTAATNFSEDKWVRAIEVRPGARSVVHHILAFVQSPDGSNHPRAFKQIPIGEAAKAAVAGARERTQQEGSERPNRTLIGTMAPGTNPMVFDAGTALRIFKGSELVFQVHYTTVGTPTLDRSKVGLIYADGPPTREMRTSAFLNSSFEIPAGAPNERVDALVEFTEDIELSAVFPHSHLLGTRWEYRLIYPDGRSEPMLSVPRYDFNWQTYYTFETPLAIPAGTRIEASAWYDNSVANKSNPDPSTPSRWGEQTWEEMHYTGITYSIPVSTSTISE